MRGRHLERKVHPTPASRCCVDFSVKSVPLVIGKAVVSLYVYVLTFCFRLKSDYKSVINFGFSLLATFSTSSAAHAPRYAGLGYFTHPLEPRLRQAAAESLRLATSLSAPGSPRAPRFGKLQLAARAWPKRAQRYSTSELIAHRTVAWPGRRQPWPACVQSRQAHGLRRHMLGAAPHNR